MKTCYALTFSTLLQNRSYENGCEMSKNACARAKRAKLLLFVFVKHANLSLVTVVAMLALKFLYNLMQNRLKRSIGKPSQPSECNGGLFDVGQMQTSVYYNSACISLFAVLDLSEETTYEILSALFYSLCRKCNQSSFVFTLGKLKIGQIAKIKYK